MTLEVHNLGRVSVTEESVANFATDLTGSATYYDIPTQGAPQLVLEQDMLDTQQLQQYHYGYPKPILGTKRATLTLTWVLAPTNSAADASTTVKGKTDSGQFALLDLVFGGLGATANGTLAAGSAVVASPSPTTSTFSVTGGQGTRFGAGGAVGLLTGASSAYEMREVEGVATDAVTLKHALSNAPNTSDVVYNSTTVYPEDNPTSSIQMVARGVEPNDGWLLLGGQVTSAPTLTLEAGQLPTMSCTITFCDWNNMTTGDLDNVYSSSGGAISAATYSNWYPVAAVTGEFFGQVVGTAGRQLLEVQRVSYTLNGPVFVPQVSPSGTNTVYAWRMNHVAPFATCDITLPYGLGLDGAGNGSDTGWFTARDAGTTYHLAMQIGNVQGQSMLIVLPTAVCTNVQRVGEGELASQTVTFAAMHDADATDTTTAWRRAPFRSHFG